MKLRCQICDELIAEVDQAKLAYPMLGFMFSSVDPHHGFAPPFPEGADWESFRCPYGPHRPMVKDCEIQTDQGLINLLGGGTPQWTREEALIFDEDTTIELSGTECPDCGKVFEKEINMRRHARLAHKGGVNG